MSTEKIHMGKVFSKTIAIAEKHTIPFFYLVFLFSIPFKNAIFQISLALINLSFIFLLISKRDFRTFFMPYRSVWAAMGLIALSMGISNFLGVSGLLGWEEMIKHILRFYLFFFATIYFFHHRKIDLPFIACALFFVFFAHAFYGLAQYFLGVDFFGNAKAVFGERLVGVTYNPNQFGFIMALAVVFSFGTGIQIKKIAPDHSYRLYRFLLIFLWVVSFWCLLQSGSRAAWLAAASGMFLAAVLTPGYLKQKKTWALFLVLVAVLFSLFKINPLFQERMQTLIAADSSHRVEVWKECLQYVIKKPFFGYGLEAYQKLDRVHPEIHSVHNVFVSLLLEMGIAGFLAYLYLFFICLKRLFLPEYSQPSTSVFSGILVVFLVSGQFSHTLLTDKIYLSCLYLSLALIFVGRARKGFAQYQELVKSPLPPKTVLLIEPNSFHGEVVLGYTEYFIQLGFFVHVVVTPRQMNAKPFALNHLDNVRFYAIDEIFFKALLTSDHASQYTMILFASAHTHHGPITYYLNHKAYQKTLAVLHNKNELLHKKMQKLYQERRLVVLRNFLNDPLLFEVNPHTFGQVTHSSRNKETRFICVGVFKPALRNTALLIDAVDEIVSSGIRNFTVTIITRKKPRGKIPKSVASFLNFKIGLNSVANRIFLC